MQTPGWKSLRVGGDGTGSEVIERERQPWIDGHREHFIPCHPEGRLKPELDICAFYHGLLNLM